MINVARFEAKYEKTESGCWLWRASVHPAGYGRFAVNRVICKAHRVAWEIANGPVPGALHVLHKCDVRNCVNPAHLFLGTNEDNHRDKVEKGRHPKGDRHYARQRPESVRRGEAAPAARLTEDTVREIRRAYAAGEGSLRAIGTRHGISKSGAHLIVTRANWRHAQ